jgi:hypothetical protein
MSKVIDDRNKVVYGGSLESCMYVINLATCEPAEVTEEDEIIYGDFLKSSWTGQLKIDVIRPRIPIDIKFKGIDSWNRPVFKTDGGKYIGSVNTLFPDKEKAPNNTNKEISDYLKNNLSELEYFGDYFDCEPMGGLNPLVDLIIID